MCAVLVLRWYGDSCGPWVAVATVAPAHRWAPSGGISTRGQVSTKPADAGRVGYIVPMGWELSAEVVTASVLALVVVLLLLVAAMFLRRRLLSRGARVFDCAANLHPASKRGFTVGMARYADERFEWFRAFSVAAGPSLVVPRRGARLVHQAPRDADGDSLVGLATVVRLELPGRSGRRTVDLALDAGSATGLMSWLEAAPPGV